MKIIIRDMIYGATYLTHEYARTQHTSFP